MDECKKLELQAEFDNAATIASHESTIAFATLAIKSLLLLTGGAAVAVLTFVGNIKTGLPNYASAVILFGWAAAGAVLTAGSSYLAQHFFTAADGSDVSERRGTILQWVSVGIWIASLITFLFGIHKAASAIVG